MKKLLLFIFVCCFISCRPDVEDVVVALIETNSGHIRNYNEIRARTYDTAAIKYIDSIKQVYKENSLYTKGIIEGNVKEYPAARKAIDENLKLFE